MIHSTLVIYLLSSTRVSQLQSDLHKGRDLGLFPLPLYSQHLGQRLACCKDSINMFNDPPWALVTLRDFPDTAEWRASFSTTTLKTNSKNTQSWHLRVSSPRFSIFHSQFLGGASGKNQEIWETSVPSQGIWKISWRRAWQPTPAFLPGESPWTEEPGGLQSMGVAESDTTEAT